MVLFSRFSSQRSYKDFRKIFEIKQHSRSFRKSRSKIIQGPSQDVRDQIFFQGLKINQGPSEDLPCLRSFKDLRKIFEINYQSRIFGRSSRSKIIQESSGNLRDQNSFEDHRKSFEIKGHSRNSRRSS